MIHTIPFQVRDYECDIQGIVNNGIYTHYLEHARHQLLKDKQLDFAQLVKNNINLVVIKAELNYKKPLQSGDEFVVQSEVVMESKLKFVFHQTILKAETIILIAKITGVSLNKKGKPFVSHKLLDNLIG